MKAGPQECHMYGIKALKEHIKCFFGIQRPFQSSHFLSDLFVEYFFLMNFYPIKINFLKFPSKVLNILSGEAFKRFFKSFSLLFSACNL